MWSLPLLFGDPKPIVVLQEIAIGFFDFWAFLKALSISFDYVHLFL